ncbi:hypothetical protein F511_00170 [Dorcoceras hygrometricum]|nr:hypothetical protein F511_00170 [Dorcoceras hygrometricum]
MGNTDPNKTKAGNKYEVMPQYEERTKQINMQHDINQYYECMRAAKEISQLGQCINRKNISGRLYTTANQPGNHRSVNYRNPSVLIAQWLKLLKQSSKYKGLLTQTFTLAEVVVNRRNLTTGTHASYNKPVATIQSQLSSRKALNNPDANLETQRFNLTRRRRIAPSTGSSNPQLVTQSQYSKRGV